MGTLEPYLIGVAFCLVHILAPIVFRHRRRLEPHLSSVAGGFACSYIFLELLPAVSTEHLLLGDRIYLIILGGFGFFLSIEYILHHSKKMQDWIHVHASSGIAIAMVYNLLLAVAMIREVPRVPIAAALFAVLIGFHLLSTDLGLMEEHHKPFMQYGRFVLMGAIALGLCIHLWIDPSEQIADVLAAIVTGTILYKVFSRELPDFDQANALSFCGGAIFFAVTHHLISVYV